MDEDEAVKQLMEEHKDDFANTEENTSDEGNDSGGDNSQDNSNDENSGTDNNNENNTSEQNSKEIEEGNDEGKEGEVESTESNDSDDTKTEQVGEKKDANSRIRQLLEEQKELKLKLAEKEEAERKAAEAKEDPVYELDDFIGTLDEDGNVLTDTEAKARFKAWEADYKLRQFQKEQVLKDQQNTLIELQRQTSEAFKKFPEFDMTSEEYDEKLAGLANRMFEAGLEYDSYGRVVGSKINPSELLESLHSLRQEKQVTKVNNLPSEDNNIVSSQQVNRKVNKYAPGFRGDVDRELDNLIKKGF